MSTRQRQSGSLPISRALGGYGQPALAADSLGWRAGNGLSSLNTRTHGFETGLGYNRDTSLSGVAVGYTKLHVFGDERFSTRGTAEGAHIGL